MDPDDKEYTQEQEVKAYNRKQLRKYLHTFLSKEITNKMAKDRLDMSIQMAKLHLYPNKQVWKPSKFRLYTRQGQEVLKAQAKK